MNITTILLAAAANKAIPIPKRHRVVTSTVAMAATAVAASQEIATAAATQQQALKSTAQRSLLYESSFDCLEPKTLLPLLTTPAVTNK